MRRAMPIMLGITMLSRLWAGGPEHAWGVHIHGPIPDPGNAESDGHEKSPYDARESSDAEAEDLTTGAERARQEQYRDAEGTNPWFRYPREAPKDREGQREGVESRERMQKTR